MDPISRSGSNSTKADSAENPYLSVSDVTRLVNDILELQFSQLLFRGEISQITVAQSGHVYFSIKDEGAQLSCAMWAGVARTLPFKPRVGMAVRCHGRPNVYAQTGRFQIVVHRLFEDGEGALQRRFLELRKRLQDEGFFSSERKRPLPFLPRAVGIVTSKTGAVIHDMMVKIRERFPSMVVYLADTRVQGEGAAGEIAAAIRSMDRSGLVDVIIVARGGGSLEDLWAFNEEELVKAVFACSRPVVSGVGHEVDVTLCDLAADVRAPTPTAAAEMVVPKVSDLSQRVGELERRLSDVDRWFQPRVQRLDDLTLRLDARLSSITKEAQLRIRAAELSLARIKPDKVMDLMQMRVNVLEKRLRSAVEGCLKSFSVELSGRIDRLKRTPLLEAVKRQQAVVVSLEGRLSGTGHRSFSVWRQQVASMQARLEALNPKAVLDRGYSILRIDGKHVRSAEQALPGGVMEVQVVDGVVSGTVISTRRMHG